MTDFTLYQYPQENQPSYIVSGANCQVLTLQLESGSHMVTEPGSLVFCSPEVEPTIKWNCCNGKYCSGESCISVIYTNNGPSAGYIGLTPWFPGKVVPIDLRQHNIIKCRLGAYFSDNSNVFVDTACECRPERVCCAGIGCFQQRITGSGTVFLGGGGTIITKVLETDERIVVDNASVLAWQDSVKVGAKCAGSLMYCFYGGEGFFNTTLTGPGLVVLQSMPFEKLQKLLTPKAPDQNQLDGDNNENQNN